MQKKIINLLQFYVKNQPLTLLVDMNEIGTVFYGKDQNDKQLLDEAEQNIVIWRSVASGTIIYQSLLAHSLAFYFN